jgi:hypothetical protein
MTSDNGDPDHCFFSISYTWQASELVLARSLFFSFVSFLLSLFFLSSKFIFLFCHLRYLRSGGTPLFICRQDICSGSGGCDLSMHLVCLSRARTKVLFFSKKERAVGKNVRGTEICK